MDYLQVSETGTQPLHPAEPRSVAIDYASVALARSKALQAFARAENTVGTDAERVERLEESVQELSDAVLALVSVLTEVCSGLKQRDVHIVNYPAEPARV